MFLLYIENIRAEERTSLLTTYNVVQQQFPTSLVAGLAKASVVELWEITDPGERSVPKVDLSLP